MKLLSAIAFAVILLAWSNHFHNTFHFDDFHTIVNNPAIRDFRNVPKFFTDPSTTSVLAANRVWRPLLVTSLALDYRLAGGLKPEYFQADAFLQFLLFLGCAFALFRNILKTPYAALFATTLLGLHPAMAETVNYICQRGDIMVALGIVAGLAIYANQPRLRPYFLYLVPVILALLAKPPALVFAPLLFAYVWYFETDTERNRWAAAARASAPSFAVVGVMLWLHSAMTPKSFAPSTLSAFDYIVTQPYVAFRSFRTFFLPLWLSADTDLTAFADPLHPLALFGFVFVLALLAAIGWTANRRELRPVSFGLTWFVLGLLPTAVFPLAEVENDHRLFLPFIGLALAAAWVGVLLVRHFAWSPKLTAAVALAPLLLGAGGVHTRNEVWRSEETLWHDVTIKSPANGRGLMNYGVALLSLNRIAEAAHYFELALPLTPSYSNLYINLGVAYGALGRASEAEAQFRRAIDLAPNEPGPWVFFGRWLVSAGRRSEAIPILQTALSKDGDHAEAPSLLASLIRTQGDPVEAAQKLAAAAPTPENYLDLSLQYYNAKKFRDSIKAAEEALRLRPTYAEAWNNVAAGHAALREWAPAIEAATRAVQLKPDFQLAKNNLAWAVSQQKK